MGLKLYNNQLNSNKPVMSGKQNDDDDNEGNDDDDDNGDNNVMLGKGSNDVNQMHKLDRFKLESIVHELTEESYKRDEMISKQNEEINQIKQRINELEKKVKIVMTHHAQKQQGQKRIKK